jgi:ABC-2 type transport system ATP-binding protein
MMEQAQPRQLPPQVAGASAPPLPPPPLGPVAPPPILTTDLTKRYGGLTALDQLNLRLEAGDIYGFIGPNGAGKSTTMKILAGLLDATSGSAFVLGKPVDRNGEFVRRLVGYMPDFFGVYEDLTVHEYLDFFASAYGLHRRQRRKVVADVLELTDLSFKADALVDSLSRGMQQRLGLARVLVHDPPILLLDEPASGLDPRARIEIRELLRELRRLGKTILISSHILSELGEFCNKLGIIERGQLLVSGTIDELIARARVRPVITVQVVDQADKARQVLQQDARVESIESVAGNGDAAPAGSNGRLHITLRDPGLHHHFLVELLLSAGLRLESIAPEQVKLEDVFLRLTKGAVQ